MNKDILIYDGVCPKPYTLQTLRDEPMGGTEATVLRIADALHAKDYNVVVEQRHRLNHETTNVHYTPLDQTLEGFNPKVVITLRDAGHYVSNKLRFPKAKHFLWLHDVASGDYGLHLRMHLKGQEGTLVTVSDWHRTNVREELSDASLYGNLRVKRVYNPLASDCVNKGLGWIEGTTGNGSLWKFPPFYTHKLVYFSSPHKGLDQVLQMFGYLRNIDPKFELYLANPGYYANKTDLPAGVINLGALTHSQVIDHVRTSLCVFYPNMVFSETFGLVYAEANAVGTPVIAHPIGSAKEVLSHPHETMDCRDYKAVIDRVIKWSKGERPIVSARKEFRLDAVINEWIKLFDSK